MHVPHGKRADRAAQHKRQDDERYRQTIEHELDREYVEPFDLNPVAEFNRFGARVAAEHYPQDGQRRQEPDHDRRVAPATDGPLAERTIDERGQADRQQQRDRRTNDGQP